MCRSGSVRKWSKFPFTPSTGHGRGPGIGSLSDMTRRVFVDLAARGNQGSAARSRPPAHGLTGNGRRRSRVRLDMTSRPHQVSTTDHAEFFGDAGLQRQLAVYSKHPIGAGFQNLMAARLASALRGVDTRLERVIVRFEDLNGPKGGADTACRIQLVLSGKPVIVVEARAEGEGPAFRRALPRLAAALDRQRDRERRKPRATLRLRAPDAAARVTSGSA